MDSRWFKEDRKLPKNEQADAIKETEKALKNSTLLRGRLKDILDTELMESFRIEEDFDDPNWERKHVAEAARRKTLRQIVKLLDF